MLNREVSEKQAYTLLRKIIDDRDWSKAVFTTKLRDGGSNPDFVLYDKAGNSTRLVPFEIFDVDDLFRPEYDLLKNDSQNRFNKAEFTIYPDSSYQTSYWWDDEEVTKSKIAWSKVLPQWVNDRLISLLFSAGYGTEKNWQRGVFTFTVRNGTLLFDGVIYNSDIVTTVDVTLPEYLVEGIVEHYQLTNEGVLKDQWQPWNQMVIRSPHNDLDLGKDVTYTNAAVGKRGSIG